MKQYDFDFKGTIYKIKESDQKSFSGSIHHVKIYKGRNLFYSFAVMGDRFDIADRIFKAIETMNSYSV